MNRTHARVAMFVWLLTSMAVAPAAARQTATGPEKPKPSAQERLYDVVLTSITDDGSTIVMATLALPHARFELLFRGSAPQWRFRLLPLQIPLKATSVSITADATKAVVTTDDNQVHVVDLAQRVHEIPQAPASAPTRYTQEWITYVSPDRNAALIADIPAGGPGTIATDDPDCRAGVTAIARTTPGRVWLIGRNDAVCDGSIEKGVLRVTRRRVPDERNLMLVHRAGDVRLVGAQPGAYTQIDPETGQREPLPNVDTTTEALLLAAGKFADQPGGDHRGAVKRLARELDAQALAALENRHINRPALRPWSVWTVTANVDLYAPSLEFAENEPVRPTSIEVWKTIEDELTRRVPNPRELGWKDRAAEMLATYQRSVFAGSTCSIYVAHRSYAGSWLFEYWTYYPFDVGQGSHYHDTEHVFVEVDKLGGAVHQVIGAAHGVWAPNNIYRAASPNVPPATLPLYSIAEFGKHASAPDINRDLKFNIGVDVNTFRDRAKVWGVRDTTAFTDSNLRGYDANMVVDRKPQHIWYSQAFDRFFPGGRSEGSRPKDQQCRLLDFPPPDTKACTDRSFFLSDPGPTAECAAERLNKDDDYKTPSGALKRSYAPVHTLRYSYGWRPHVGADGGLADSQPLHSFGGFGEISWFKFIPEPMRAAGRIAVEVYFPRDFFKTSSPVHFEGFQLRYERLSSNLAGFYVGASFMKDPPRDGHDDKWFGGRYRRWLDAGALFEFAPNKHINTGVQLGLSYTNGAGMGFDIRFVGALLQQGKFGIKKKTKSSY